MKKNQSIKLSLNKQIIANLNNLQMKNVLGGDDGGNMSAGLNDTTPCDLNESIMIPEICENIPPSPDTTKPLSDNCPQN